MQDFNLGRNMKEENQEIIEKNYQNLIKAVLFLLGLGVIFFFMNAYYKTQDQGKYFFIKPSNSNQFVYEKENTIDVLFLGDSLCQTGFSPYEMWEEYGFTSFVCGSSGQYTYESFDYLKKFFQKQSPKVVVLEVDTLHRYSTVEYYSIQALGDYTDIVDKHDNWKEKANKLFSFPNESGMSEWLDPMKGYLYEAKIEPAENYEDYMKYSKKSSNICPTNKYVLTQMKKLCENNGATLILVSMPSTTNCNYRRKNAVDALAKKNGLTVLDYNVGELKDAVSIDWMMDSRDGGDHLSYTGMRKVNVHLGKYLSETYNLKDRRNDESYLDWQKGLDNYYEVIE